MARLALSVQHKYSQKCRAICFIMHALHHGEVGLVRTATVQPEIASARFIEHALHHCEAYLFSTEEVRPEISSAHGKIWKNHDVP